MIKYPSEHEEQVGFLQWFEAQFPGVAIFAIPNGARVGMGHAVKLKKEGLRKGVPDLFIPQWLTWVEMKRAKGGRLSSEQIEWKKNLENLSHLVIVGKGAADASRQIVRLEPWLRRLRIE